MRVGTEFSDLVRAVARRDWEAVDQLLDEFETAGWQGGNQVIGTAFANTALQMQIVFLGKLLQDRDLTEAQLEEFIAVERTAAEYL
ncbi:hypothetical protein [Micromonospora sp. NPDC005203]|uniref:hypothetical protein n=1 Tax=Micromonospora sp. NPDC005203 TaxID=3364226 RepID=UPI00369E6823